MAFLPHPAGVLLCLLTWLVALFPYVLADDGSLSQTCTGIELRGKYSIVAVCSAAPDKSLRNQLDLNLCIGLDHITNELAWSVYGKLSNYCSSCTLATGGPGNILTCTCKSMSSTAPATVSSLQLDDGIKTVNGTLTCLGGIASVSVVNLPRTEV